VCVHIQSKLDMHDLDNMLSVFSIIDKDGSGDVSIYICVCVCVNVCLKIGMCVYV